MNEAWAPNRNTLHPFHFNPEVGSLPTPQRVNALNEAVYGKKPNSGKPRNEILYYWKRPRIPGLPEQVAALWPPAATEARLPDSEAVPAPRDASPVFQYPGA